MQLEMLVTVVRPHTLAELHEIRQLPHLGAACHWACAQRLPQLTQDQICERLGIDAATWSRIKNGQPHSGAAPAKGKKKASPANPSDKLILAIRDLTGSEAPTLWLLMKQGYDPASLRLFEDEQQRLLREANQRADRAEQRAESAEILIAGVLAKLPQAAVAGLLQMRAAA